MNTFLAHHGVKGMRWGVRRYQNEDGTYTNAGLKRYKKDRAQYKKEQVQYSKDLTKLSGQKNKSKHVQRLEEKYKRQGMTDEEASVAAYRRAKTEKILAAALGVVVVAGVSYGAYRIYKHNVDQTIKSGSLLQNISTNPSKGVADAFYASTNAKDDAAYRGLYGKTLGQTGKAVYEAKIKALDDLRVASPKSAEREFVNLMSKDKEFAKYVKDLAVSSQNKFGSPGQVNLAKRAADSIGKGKVDKKVYELFNVYGMVYNQYSPEGNKMRQRFMDALKAKGYDAVGDINDRKYSGYGTKNPLILLGDTAKLAVSARRELGSDEVDGAYAQTYGKLLAKAYAKSLAKPAAGIAAGVAASTAIKNKVSKANTAAKRQQIVAQYKQEHPNSQLSNKQILDNYYEGE